MAYDPHNSKSDAPPSISDELVERLSAYVDGELTEPEQKDVEKLLAQNAAARQELVELRQVAGYVSELKQEPKVDLAAAVQASIAHGPVNTTTEASNSPGETPRLRIGQSPRSWAYALVALAAAVLVMVLVPGDSDEVKDIAAASKAPASETPTAKTPTFETQPRPPLELRALPTAKPEAPLAPMASPMPAAPPATESIVSSSERALAPPVMSRSMSASGPVPSKIRSFANAAPSLVLNVMVNRQERSANLVQTALRESGIEVAEVSLAELSPQTRQELAQIGLEPSPNKRGQNLKLGQTDRQAEYGFNPPSLKRQATPAPKRRSAADGQASQFYAQRRRADYFQRPQPAGSPRFQSQSRSEATSQGYPAASAPSQGAADDASLGDGLAQESSSAGEPNAVPPQPPSDGENISQRASSRKAETLEQTIEVLVVEASASQLQEVIERVNRTTSNRLQRVPQTLLDSLNAGNRADAEADTDGLAANDGREESADLTAPEAQASNVRALIVVESAPESTPIPAER